ncbi:MAG: serine/threonine-protein kinase, partial [Stackebrandtia sp.]
MMAPNDHAGPANSDFPDLADVTVIAQGAHATVYRAYQVSGGRVVALKVDNRVLDSEEERQRFEREVRAVGRLAEHPGIIDTYIAGFTGTGQPYVVTELCRGSYADKMADAGALPPEEVQRVGIRIADALAVAHENRVLHRDIKPANLLVDNGGQPVLADFGVASLMDSRTEESVVRAAMTPAYAPLETFHLRPSGEPGDVYSLAATLYALLSGRPPRFPADNHDLSIDDVMSLFGEPIADVSGVSQVMLGMLRAAMTNNPAGRPSALQFRDMLDSVPMAAATGAIPVTRPAAESGAEPAGGLPAEPVSPPPMVTTEAPDRSAQSWPGRLPSPPDPRRDSPRPSPRPRPGPGGFAPQPEPGEPQSR